MNVEHADWETKKYVIGLGQSPGWLIK